MNVGNYILDTCTSSPDSDGLWTSPPLDQGNWTHTSSTQLEADGLRIIINEYNRRLPTCINQQCP